MKHLGNAVVCKHGDFVDVVEFSEVFTVEASPDVRDEDLGPLVQSYFLAIEDCLVTETGKILGEKVDKTSGGVVGAVDAVYKAASKFLKPFNLVTNYDGMMV